MDGWIIMRELKLLAAEVWEWISNLISHFTEHVITSCSDLSSSTFNLYQTKSLVTILAPTCSILEPCTYDDTMQCCYNLVNFLQNPPKDTTFRARYGVSCVDSKSWFIFYFSHCSDVCKTVLYWTVVMASDCMRKQWRTFWLTFFLIKI